MTGILEYAHYTLRFLRFFLSNLYTLPCYVTWITLLTPLRVFAPGIFWKLESFMFAVIQGMIVTWMRGYQVLECGDDIRELCDEECLMLANHQSTADTPLVMLINYNKGSVKGTTTWIMWYIFKYTNFGLVSLLREDFFIHNGKDIRVSEMDRLTKYMETSFIDHNRKWVVIFPEGGFLHKRRDASQAFAKKNNYPVLNNVTLPRIGAAQAVLSTVGEPYTPASVGPNDEVSQSNGLDHQQHTGDEKKRIKWVIDVTLAYKDAKPLDMLGMCVGYCPKNLITVHYKAYRVKDIPRDTAGLTDWMYQRYEEKDKMLEEFYKTGKYSDEVLAERRLLKPLEPTYLRFDVVQNLLVHAFCICSCYLHYVFVYKPLYAALCGLLSFVF